MIIERVRNFCIVAHVDHGKSTLADRLLETTGTLTPQQMKAQVLDNMDLERERGITIKSHPITMDYRNGEGVHFRLNLIDTPGHVDFSYEVSRSLAACEGAVLLVDATQGVQAQTLSHGMLAIENRLVLVPAVRKLQLLAPAWLRQLPLFEGPPLGVGMGSAVLILAIMMLPFTSSVAREILKAVPMAQREAAYALGATRFEAIRAALFYARTGIVGAVMLGLGRALGETMAVTMVIGNNPQVSASLFAPQYTMAAVIANEFTEAADDLYLHALVEIGLVLFLITLAINALSRLLIYGMDAKQRRKAARSVA